MIALGKSNQRINFVSQCINPLPVQRTTRKAAAEDTLWIQIQRQITPNPQRQLDIALRGKL
jgi:hypothetical protein